MRLEKSTTYVFELKTLTDILTLFVLTLAHYGIAVSRLIYSALSRVEF